MPVAGSTRWTGARSHSPRLDRVDAAEAADGDGARGKAALGERADHDIERDIVAAHDDEVRRALGFADQSDVGAGAGIERRGQRIDRQKPVGLRKGGDRARAFAGGERDRAVVAGDERDQHEFLAAKLGGDPHRQPRGDGFRRFGRKPGAGADDRRDEGVKGENRRGRKARQHDQRLVADHRKAQRLARLERHAVHQNARRAELRHDAMRQVARALRGAARKHDDVAAIERVAHRQFERQLIVRQRAERHWLAARLDDRGGKDGAVAVIDAAGRSGFPGSTSSSPVESTATRGRRTTSAAANPQAASMPISREPIGVPRRSKVSPRAMSEPA